MDQTNSKKELQSIIDKADPRLIRVLLAASRAYYGESAEAPVQNDSARLYRLVYTSARTKKCDDQAIRNILEHSVANNKKLDITGILIYTDKRFLQVLEGRRDRVTQLYDKIKKDKRHGGSIMRYCNRAEGRHFAEWSMAGKKFDSGEITYNTAISEQQKQLYASMLDGDIQSYTDEGMRVIKSFLLFS